MKNKIIVIFVVLIKCFLLHAMEKEESHDCECTDGHEAEWIPLDEGNKDEDLAATGEVIDAQIYTPKNVADDSLDMVWVNIHGTNLLPPFIAADVESFSLLKDCAAWCAETFNRKITFFTFRWTGENRGESRLDAAPALRKILKRRGFLNSPKSMIIIAAHSHGCNVANNLTELIDSTYPISYLFYFACPPRNELYYQPRHYENLYYFWSEMDCVVPLGRRDGRKATDIAKGMLEVIKITVPITQCSGTKRYKQCVSFKPKKRRLTVGIKVKTLFNAHARGSNSGRAPGHSEFKELFPVMPLILYKLFTCFPTHCISNSTFKLYAYKDRVMLKLDEKERRRPVFDTEVEHQDFNERIRSEVFTNELVEMIQNDRFSHFVYCVEQGDFSMALRYLELGADINSTDKLGQNVLFFQMPIERLQFFIDRGANVNARDYQGKTPLHVQLKICARNDKSSIVKRLVEHGAEVNAQDKKGNSILHGFELYTTKKGKLVPYIPKDIIAYLTDNAFNVNIRDNRGDSLLHCRNKCALKMIKRMVTYGAYVNIRDNRGRTPLHVHWSLPIIKHLVDNGADVDSRDDEGSTPLHVHHDRAIMEYLIAHGADVNARDNAGRSVLNRSCRIVITEKSFREIRNLALEEFLIEKGAIDDRASWLPDHEKHNHQLAINEDRREMEGIESLGFLSRVLTFFGLD